VDYFRMVQFSTSFYDVRKHLNRTKLLAFYKRSTFLIDPKFQLRFSVVVSVLFVLGSLIYTFVVYDFINDLGNQYALTKLGVSEAARSFLIFLIPFQFLLTAMVLLISIFLTHKVAGPLYKLKNHLVQIREGDAISPLEFRTGDNFKDVAEEVSLFLEWVTANQEADFKYIDEVAAYVENLSMVIPDDKKPVLNEISRRLKDITFRYKKDN
jgi:ABC-type multidrug transport system fused ATPase/permease subunit